MGTKKARSRASSKRGGPRRGAGRPREFEDKRQLIVLLEGTEADALKELAWEARLTVSRYLRQLVRRHLTGKGRLT